MVASPDSHIRSALSLLRLARTSDEAIGVAVSFGKDSLAVLDLCCRVFRRVEAYYLYRIRDLDIVERWRKEVLNRHGVDVRMYPHFDLCRSYRNAVLMPHWRGIEKTPRVKMRDIDDQFREDAKVEWIAYGWRHNDSYSRALVMKQCAGCDFKARRVFPLRAWSRNDVYAYLDARGIPRPSTFGRKEQGGLDFHPEALRELKEKFPSDYERYLRDFPFAYLQLDFAAQVRQKTELASLGQPGLADANRTAPRRRGRPTRGAE